MKSNTSGVAKPHVEPDQKTRPGKGLPQPAAAVGSTPRAHPGSPARCRRAAAPRTQILLGLFVEGQEREQRQVATSSRRIEADRWALDAGDGPRPAGVDGAQLQGRVDVCRPPGSLSLAGKDGPPFGGRISRAELLALLVLARCAWKDARGERTGSERSDLIGAVGQIMPLTVGPNRRPAQNGVETMKALAWSALVVGVSLGTALSAAAQTPVGALALDERRGDQYGWAVDYETPAAARAAALRECGGRVFGGADVCPVRGVCGGSGCRQHGGGVGRSVYLRRSRPAGGAVRVPFAGRRFGVHRAGMGLQRPGGRGGAESRPGGPASDPAASSGRRLRSRWGGRPVRSADAGGDTAVAVVARRAGDRVSGRSVGRGAANGGWGRLWP